MSCVEVRPSTGASRRLTRSLAVLADDLAAAVEAVADVRYALEHGHHHADVADLLADATTAVARLDATVLDGPRLAVVS